jgi:hypothetical protein
MKRFVAILLFLLGLWFGITLIVTVCTFLWALVTYIPHIGKDTYLRNTPYGTSDPMTYFTITLVIIGVKAGVCFFFFWAGQKLLLSGKRSQQRKTGLDDPRR